MHELIARLEALTGEAWKEQSDLDYYSGGSNVNYSQRELGAFVMKNCKEIISALRAQEESNAGR